MKRNSQIDWKCEVILTYNFVGHVATSVGHLCSQCQNTAYTSTSLPKFCESSISQPIKTQIPLRLQHREESLLKILWDKEKIVLASIFSFSTMFSAQSKKQCTILTTLELLSANVLNLDTGPTFFDMEKSHSHCPGLATHKPFFRTFLALFSRFFYI